ncbi:oligomeric golgi complex component, COG2-domain-containing protein [Clohesyomyces aquaticus]|uniref:Conserved oligomeric Golgi complex subunit 2 n=1 Tax=Clohesyomyces aquaticus TaxID=1231657 RepID=A0A1Y2A9Q4_9PLEO|nr:oligomeric golgi complex component, COG2-domain-containing protein [Clohesyomyces aquaticus]
MSRFYFGDSSNSSNSGADDDDDDTLPYPAPLQRSDFLAPDFSPSTYLSSLRNRHQTLEDLRSELRSRSQLLSKELLDLVNSNYQDFLGLGRSLKSGDEKVEEVRVGLLGFRKEVEGVRGKVVEREESVRELVEERIAIRKQIAMGRALVDYDARLALLEGQLMVEMAGKSAAANGYEDFSDSEEDSDEEEEGAYSMSVSKLRRHVLKYRLIQQVGKGVGVEHPIIIAQAPRMMKVRNTLLLDLSAALQQAQSAGTSGADRVLKVMKIYADMDESVEAVKVLKSLKAA